MLRAGHDLHAPAVPQWGAPSVISHEHIAPIIEMPVGTLHVVPHPPWIQRLHWRLALGCRMLPRDSTSSSALHLLADAEASVDGVFRAPYG
jgi:hypothetical protein